MYMKMMQETEHWQDDQVETRRNTGITTKNIGGYQNGAGKSIIKFIQFKVCILIIANAILNHIISK